MIYKLLYNIFIIFVIFKMITRENFENNLELVYESIEQADFISIDCEFSGYSSSPNDLIQESDSLEEKY